MQVDNAKDLDLGMLMYNLIKYSDDYSNKSGSFWQYYRNKPNDTIANSELFKFKAKITGISPANGNTKDADNGKLMENYNNIKFRIRRSN